MGKLKQIWQNPFRWGKRIVIVTGLLLGIHAVSLFAGSGEVVDEETMKPIAGAFVYATWQSSGWNPVHSSTVCYHFAITQTDNKGKFTLPTFAWHPLHPMGG